MSPGLLIEFERLVALLENEGLVKSMTTPSGDRLLVVRQTAANDAEPPPFLSYQEGARLVGTSVSSVRKAVRQGDLTAYGGQRDRALKRCDLLAWAEGRKAPILTGEDSPAIAARVARLVRDRAEKGRVR